MSIIFPFRCVLRIFSMITMTNKESVVLEALLFGAAQKLQKLSSLDKLERCTEV